MGFGVIGAMLNNSSLVQTKELLEITMIRRSEIEKNGKNNRSIEGIEELAEDIRRAGIEQPLVVYQLDNGKYRLLTGERRITAVDLNISLGETEPDPYLPCVVKDLDEDYGLPLNDDLKERYAIQRTNRFNRNPTEADKMHDYLEWKEIVTALKKQGYDKITVGVDEKGEEIIQPLKGRTREIAGAVMETKVSSGQLAKFDKINNNAVPQLLEAIQAGRINIAVAFRVVDLEPVRQEAFLLQTQDLHNIEKQDLDFYLNSLKPATTETIEAGPEEEQIPGQDSILSHAEYLPSETLNENDFKTVSVKKEDLSGAVDTAEQTRTTIYHNSGEKPALRAMEEKHCTYASEKPETLFLPGKKTPNINETLENKKNELFSYKDVQHILKVKERELKELADGIDLYECMERRIVVAGLQLLLNTLK